MKYKLIIISFLFFLTFSIFTGRLLAAPTNGPRLLPKGGIESGYECHIIFKRALDRSYGNLRTENHFYTLSFGIFDWLCLDGKIGLGDVTQKGGVHLPKIEYNTGFAGGYGFRIKFFDHPETGISIVVGAQHVSTHPEDRSVDDDKFESFLDDWQVSGIISKRFKFCTPYIGMKFSDCEIVYKINKHDRKRRYSENHIGFLFGSDLYLLNDKVRINIEARLIDESALSTAIAYLF